MKRSSFKRPTLDEVRAKQAAKKEKALKNAKVPKSPKNVLKGQKQPKKRKKKTERQSLEEKIWAECKRIIRARHGDTCYTCGAQGLEGVNWQTGHGKAKSLLSIIHKYDLANLRPQCFNCNINLGGMSDIFVTKLALEPEGLAFLNEACVKTDEGWRIKRDQTMGGKDATVFLRDLLEEYKKIDC